MKENTPSVRSAKVSTVARPTAPLVRATVTVSQPPVAASGIQIKAARTLTRLTRLLVRTYGEKKGRTILVEAIQQRLRTGKDIREIVAARVAANGVAHPAATGSNGDAHR